MDFNDSNKVSSEQYVTRTVTHQEAAPITYQNKAYSFETKTDGGIGYNVGGADYSSLRAINTLQGNGGYGYLAGGNYTSGNIALGGQAYGQGYAQGYGQTYAQSLPIGGQGFIQAGAVNTSPIVLDDRRYSGSAMVGAPIAYNFGVANQRTSFVLDAAPQQIVYETRPERRSVIVEPTYAQQMQVVRQPQMIPVFRQVHYVQQQQQPVVNTVTMDNSEELEQLRIQLRTRTEECQQWRLKYESLELQFRTFQETNRSSSYELETLRASYESRLSECISEIERLNGVLRVKLEEIERLRSNQSQSYEFESQITIYKNEIESMRLELESAYSAKRQKAEEAEEYRRKFMTLESSISEYKYEITRLQGDLKTKEREISDWRSRYSSLEIEIQTITETSRGNQDYEMKIALLTQEIERLNAMLKMKNKDLEEFEYQISNLKMEISRKESSISELRTQITTLEYSSTEVTSLERKLMDYENRIALLSQEIERLNSMNSSKTYEIENLKRSSMMVESKDNEIMRLRASLEEYRSSVEEWKSKYNSMSYEFSSRDGRSREMETTISSLRMEIERLQKMAMNSSEVDMWKGKYRDLEATVSSLRLEMERYQKLSMNTSELEMWKGKYRDLETTVSSLRMEIERLSMGSSEVEMWRSKYRDLETTVSSLRMEIERLSMGSSEVELWRSKYSAVLATIVLLCAEVETLRMGSAEGESSVVQYGGGTVVSSEKVMRLSGENVASSSFKRTSFNANEGIAAGGSYKSSVTYTGGTKIGGEALYTSGGDYGATTIKRTSYTGIGDTGLVSGGGYKSSVTYKEGGIIGGGDALYQTSTGGDFGASSFKRTSYNATDEGAVRGGYKSTTVYTSGSGGANISDSNRLSSEYYSGGGGGISTTSVKRYTTNISSTNQHY